MKIRGERRNKRPSLLLLPTEERLDGFTVGGCRHKLTMFSIPPSISATGPVSVCAQVWTVYDK